MRKQVKVDEFVLSFLGGFGSGSYNDKLHELIEGYQRVTKGDRKGDRRVTCGFDLNEVVMCVADEVEKRFKTR